MIEDQGEKREFGTLLLAEVTPRHLLQVRTRLIARHLAVKTVRNILDASLRAMWRDARSIDLLITTDPFAALTWPRIAAPPPDPFNRDERDTLLGWFLAHQRFDYAFPFVLFHTGMRPSEAVALRWSDVDTAAGTVSIRRSRYLGSEAAPKTRGSQRTINLVPEVRRVLRGLKPLHVAPDDYVFRNAKNGGPINQGEWPKDHWHSALRATAIRPRKFYATRHTFISIALSNGVNLKWLAEYCGTSVAMIERSYGRFLADGGDHQLALLAGTDQVNGKAQRSSARTLKTRDLGGGVSGLHRKTHVE